MPHGYSSLVAGHWLEAQGDKVERGAKVRIASDSAATGWLVASHLTNSCMILDCQVHSSLRGRWTWGRQADHTLGQGEEESSR